MYNNKLEEINEGIREGKYIETTDRTSKELTSFQNFLLRNFRKILPYDDIRPTSNQPAFLYGSAKTHKLQTPI